MIGKLPLVSAAGLKAACTGVTNSPLNARPQIVAERPVYTLANNLFMLTPPFE